MYMCLSNVCLNTSTGCVEASRRKGFSMAVIALDWTDARAKPRSPGNEKRDDLFMEKYLAPITHHVGVIRSH